LLGNTQINESIINLIQTYLFIEKNLNLTDSSLLFVSSNISVTGCIYLNNITLTIDLSKYSQNGTKILLLNSSSGCLSANNVNITFLNALNCLKPTSLFNSYSLIITYSNNCIHTTNSNQPPGTTIIVIVIIGSVIGIVIIVLLIVFCVPSIREAILPHEKKEK